MTFPNSTTSYIIRDVVLTVRPAISPKTTLRSFSESNLQHQRLLENTKISYPKTLRDPKFCVLQFIPHPKRVIG